MVRRVLPQARAPFGAAALVVSLALGACGAGEPPAQGSDERSAASAPDLKRGELLGLACAACHTFRAGERHNVGPNLHGVFGRSAATLPDFTYSRALESSGITWTPETVEAWLADPAGFVPGTTMVFTGYRSERDRHDLSAYLQQITSD